MDLINIVTSQEELYSVKGRDERTIVLIDNETALNALDLIGIYAGEYSHIFDPEIYFDLAKLDFEKVTRRIMGAKRSFDDANIRDGIYFDFERNYFGICQEETNRKITNELMDEKYDGLTIVPIDLGHDFYKADNDRRKEILRDYIIKETQDISKKSSSNKRYTSSRIFNNQTN